MTNSARALTKAPIRRTHIRLMPNENDRETSDTMAPPTDREAPTNPANEKPDPRPAIVPPQYDTAFLDQHDSVFAQAVKIVASVGNDINRDRVERLRVADEQARAQAELLAQQTKILEAVQKADENSKRNYELLRDEIRHLKDSDLKQDRRLAEGEERFAQIERSIENLKTELLALVERATADAAQRIDALEKQLAEAKADVPAPRPPTPSAAG